MSRPRRPRDRTGCRNCDECRPDAMTRHGLCYACCRESQGIKRTEEHHVFGRGRPDIDGITIKMPSNWHRVLDARRDRRPEVLKQPGENDLHQIAAVVVTFGEAAATVSEFAHWQQWPDWVTGLADIFAEAAQSEADRLLILAAKLEDELGSDWAEQMGMPEWHF